MTDWTDSLLYDLNVLLATLYPSVEESRPIVARAGLRAVQIPFNNQALTNWFNILDHARARNKVENVIDAALMDEPDNDALKKAKAGVPPQVAKGPKPSDWQGEKNAKNLEKIIGKKSTLVHIRYLELGVEKAKSVARIKLENGYGTGFLVKDNILITNNHVLKNPESAAIAKAQFNFQKTVDGLDAEIEELELKPESFFKTSPEHDWTMVKVDGDPVSRWGALEISQASPKNGDYVNIIQHPGGQQKQISVSANVIVFLDENRVQYLTDTLPGSSGSPVFDDEWNVIALHHSGGWLEEPNAVSKSTYYRNEGININKLINELY